MIKAQRLKTSCGEFNNDLVKHNSSTLLFITNGKMRAKEEEKEEEKNARKQKRIYTNPLTIHFSVEMIYLVFPSITDV